MEARIHMGANRTGVQMSPFDTAAMVQGEDDFGVAESDDRADLRVRSDYADEAEGLGSVPVPATPGGLVKSGVDMLKGSRPQVLLDKLGERLAFERGGVRLYDSLLVKCRCAADMLEGDELNRLQSFRQQEAEHVDTVARAIGDLGADPTAQTPCADLAGVKAMGLVQAMNDPRSSLLQSLQVILDAELLDNAGWEMLIALARNCGHDAMADGFVQAAREEAGHLTAVRAIVERLTAKEASIVGT